MRLQQVRQAVKALANVAPAIMVVPYLLYLAFVVRGNQGPIDFETFMDIGHRLLSGVNPYGLNSYYPLPFVAVFAAVSKLPRSASMIVWLVFPLAVFLLASGWQPWVLLFAPVFGHFVGGQADVFAVLGLWGFRKNALGLGGAWLALTLLKPNLALVPVGYTVVQWMLVVLRTRTIPRGAMQLLGASAVIFLPAFAVMPDWPARWLVSPRPIFERAVSGAFPRALLVAGVDPGSIGYWLLLAFAGLILLVLVRRIAGGLPLELALVWSFIVSPLVHDYDLVQLVPLLDSPRLRGAALLSSVPGWFVILFSYGDDRAWFVYALIAPSILAAMLWESRRASRRGLDSGAGAGA